MSFKTEIEALVGDIDSPDYTAEAVLYLTEGVKYVTKYVMRNPDMENRLTSSTTLNNSTPTLSLLNVLKIVSITRTDGSVARECIEIPPYKVGLYGDTNSIYYTSKLDPKYYIENNTLNILPIPTASQTAVVRKVQPDLNVALADTAIDNFPDELERGVILYASKELLRKFLNANNAGLPADINLPSVPSTASVATVTVGSLGTAPTYSKPSSAVDYSTNVAGASDAFGADDWIADEDPEMAEITLAKQGQILSDFQLDIENELNEFNKELAIYQADLTQKIKQAEVSSDKEALEIQNYATEVESYGQQINAQVANFSSKLQKINTDYQWYSDQYMKILQDLVEFLSYYIMIPAMEAQDEATAND